MLNFLYKAFFGQTDEACNIFNQEWFDKTHTLPNTEPMRMEGHDNVADLTLVREFDEFGRYDPSRNIKTRLIVKRREQLISHSLPRNSPSIQQVSLLSDWTVINNPNHSTVVYSASHPIGFIFENKGDFTLDKVKGDNAALMRLKYFQELDFIDQIEELGYSRDYIHAAKTAQPAKFNQLVESLDDAPAALKVISLEAMLGMGQREIDFPPPLEDPFVVPMSLSVGACTTRGNPSWTGRCHQHFDRDDNVYTNITLSRGEKNVTGKFTLTKYDPNTVDTLLAGARSLQLLHEWWIVESQEGQKKLSYLCKDHQTILRFEGDLDFPIDELDHEIINHQFFFERGLDNSLQMLGTSLAELAKAPGWTPNKLQSLALHQDDAKKWIEQGATLDQFARMSENKFCSLLEYPDWVGQALKFVSMDDVFGEPQRNRLVM